MFRVKTDINALSSEVRFTPESRHRQLSGMSVTPLSELGGQVRAARKNIASIPNRSMISARATSSPTRRVPTTH
jgi:hypothetical protein